MADKVIQMGYMSGDTYTAAAWLALDPSHRLILVADAREADDRSGMIRGFYQECGLMGQVFVTTPSEGVGARALFNDVKDNFNSGRPAPPRVAVPQSGPTTIEQWRSGLYYNTEPKNRWPRSITAVTGLVANAFEADADGALKTVAKTFKTTTLPTDKKFALYEFMAGKFQKVGYSARPNIVVLWSRQSGKKGAAHLEMDTSFAEIRQLARHFCSKATVLLCGDESKGKLASLAAEDAHIINLSEMWEDPFWKAHFGGAKMLAQLALFAAFQGEHQVIHYGHRSGMLESMALLGMDTFYLEPAACPSGGRMTAFQGAGIPYTRIQIEGKNLPGLTARAAQLEIERRVAADQVPVVSKGTFDYLRRQEANRLAFEDREFQKQFGSYFHKKAQKHMPTDGTRNDAHRVAKLTLGGETWTRDNVVHMKDHPEYWRGFLPADLERITGIIEARFRK